MYRLTPSPDHQQYNKGGPQQKDDVVLGGTIGPSSVVLKGEPAIIKN